MPAGTVRQLQLFEPEFVAPTKENLDGGGRLELLSQGEGVFKTLLCDPPWVYSDRSCEGAAAEKYEVLSIEDLAALPIERLADPDGCNLFLWATWPKLRDGFPQRLFRAWNFLWKSEIVWVKSDRRMGLGRRARVSSEILLWATKGRPPTLRRDAPGHFAAPRRRHSEKPEEARRLVETLSPGPRLELFSRHARPHWWRWGLEAP